MIKIITLRDKNNLKLFIWGYNTVDGKENIANSLSFPKINNPDPRVRGMNRI